MPRHGRGDGLGLGNERNVAMPMYEAFMQSQIQIARSERVINGALQHPEWKALGRPLGPESFGLFSESLAVSSPRGSELLVIAFTDTDPGAAMVAVKASMEAYEKLYHELDFDAKKKVVLENLRDTTQPRSTPRRTTS